jgi:hypothetical protein
MVEAVMALGMLVMMFGLLALVHRLSVASLVARQEARSQAWQDALSGCTANEFSVASLVRGIKSGELPVPGSFTAGQDASGSATRNVQGVAGSAQSVTRTVSVPCNTRPADAPSGSAGDWLIDLFQ